MFGRKQQDTPLPEKRKGRIDLEKLASQATSTSAERGTGKKRAIAPTTKAAPGGAGVQNFLGADSPWFTDPVRFPRTGPRGEQLRFCVAYATLAPSSHNSQPWKFRVDDDAVFVYADRTRALPVADPNDRELTISVGCAVECLSIALHRFGVEHTVELPHADERDLLAVVRTGAEREATSDARRLFDAMLRRRTTRTPFEDTPVPEMALKEMVALAAARHATFFPITDASTRFRVAKLVHEADVVQFGNRSFRRELAMWLHHNRSHALDGIPGYAQGMDEMTSLVAPLVVRTFDLGENRGARDEDLLLHSPLLACLGTARDTPADWVNAGRALAAVLVRAAGAGVTASYLNQPIEVAELRGHFKHMVPEAGWPQILLRMGFGPKLSHTPRRPAKDVLIMPGTPEVRPKKKPAKR
ncbi:MAG: nitroreductase family protein [Planctomycetota bacterium]|nr:nitroreductase family protein [Planctomycetota bacterium]